MSDTPQEHRTIFAMGGGGFSMEPDNLALDQYILAQTGKERPKVCFVPTASGDSEEYIERFHAALETLETEHSHLSLTRYNQQAPHEHLLDQDVIYVGGGNSFQMLLVWRAHGIDKTFRQAWEKGIILCGISAGSLCWFSGSITDSWGHPLRVLNDGLGFLPESHCPHYDGEPERQNIYEESIANGELPPGIAVEDSCGVLYRGTQLVEAVCSVPGKTAYRVTADGGKAKLTPIPTRTLPPHVKQ
jgi:dipeptidase E